MAEVSNPELSLHPPELYDLGGWLAPNRDGNRAGNPIGSSADRIWEGNSPNGRI
jgi:hypothetical protein